MQFGSTQVSTLFRLWAMSPCPVEDSTVKVNTIWTEPAARITGQQLLGDGAINLHHTGQRCSQSEYSLSIGAYAK